MRVRLSPGEDLGVGKENFVVHQCMPFVVLPRTQDWTVPSRGRDRATLKLSIRETAAEPLTFTYLVSDRAKESWDRWYDEMVSVK